MTQTNKSGQPGQANQANQAKGFSFALPQEKCSSGLNLTRVHVCTYTHLGTYICYIDTVSERAKTSYLIRSRSCGETSAFLFESLFNRFFYLDSIPLMQRQLLRGMVVESSDAAAIWHSRSN